MPTNQKAGADTVSVISLCLAPDPVPNWLDAGGVLAAPGAGGTGAADGFGTVCSGAVCRTAATGAA